ncbi:MAG: Biotin carboxyl carrier protein of acetyl-CoA carboxylase [Candidatus Anoxychlamydiales bacterium]|nr:Biotin carboxyl carrier protein of acetyl-CoA carboxylase [Candidatus Anoxychlamydiales bacterium]NGX51778.1 Biotin carboxyl carrier protein of acetyl-CoA carboxylase [Candidatus Anoxychlamydiales bacterium]
MEINVIKKIITLLEESNLKKIHLRDGDFEISLEKDHLEHKEVHVKRHPRPKEQELERHIEDAKDCIISPMVGTFYVSSAPDQPPFVKVGDTVNENTVVCVIEAMKVMNEIKAGRKGVIKEVLLENTQAVEFETKLFVIE